jgi:PmbA protein
MYSDEVSIRALLHTVLSYSQAEQTEVLFLSTDSALTRFAVNHIHQNVAEKNTEIRVRAVIGKRVGVASTNQLDDESLRRVAVQALETAKLQPKNPAFHSLPEPQPIQFARAYDERTAHFSPEERARRVGILIRLASEHHLEAAGAFSTGLQTIAVANSLGIYAYEQRTSANFRCVVMADEQGAGYSQQLSIAAHALDIESLAHEAVNKALRSRNPIAIELGEYPVVLESYACAEMLQNLALMGFSALAVQEERSFMQGQFGKQIANPLVTLYDDGHAPVTLSQSFDYEGVPRQRVTLIDHGIANAVVYDSFTAAREGKPNTGHALPAPNSDGPLPLSLIMEAGEQNLETLIRGIDRGIYVTRFHYTNSVHPVKTLFTGMTRDGTFLIEHGELTRPIKNLRFTQNILDVLRNVQALGSRRVQWADYDEMAITAPAIRSSTFNFTGITGA